MPPAKKFSKEQVVRAALEVARRGGQVTARAVGAELSASPKVIFGIFSGMEELNSAVLQAAEELYSSFVKADVEAGKYPPYKASGMAYIRFAREEAELFKLLFMCDRRGRPAPPVGDLEWIFELAGQSAGVAGDRVQSFHLQMWVYVHGIATMLATGYLELESGLVSGMITDVYQGLKARYMQREEADAGNQG